MKQLMMIAIALITLQATAQDKKRDRKDDQNEKHAFLKDLTPEEAATLKTKKMTLQLNLNEAQQTKVKSIIIEEAKLKKEKMELRKKNNDVTTHVRPSKDERLKMMNDRLDQQIEFKSKMKAILDDAQFEKWEKSNSKRMGSKNKKRGDKRQHKKID